MAQGEYALIISDIGRGADWEAGVHIIPEIRRCFPKAPRILIYLHLNRATRFRSAPSRPECLPSTTYGLTMMMGGPVLLAARVLPCTFTSM